MGTPARRSDHRNVSSFLHRYQSGERIDVWCELTALGKTVRDPLYLDDARAVARETMRRAADNIDVLIHRLRRIGYEFHGAGAVSRFEPAEFENPGLVNLISIINRLSSAPEGNAHGPDIWSRPAPDICERLDRLERNVGGPMPLSIRAWCEEVGAVSLLGSHAALQAASISSPLAGHRAAIGTNVALAEPAVETATAPEPLVVNPCFDGWDQPAAPPYRGAFTLTLGPANVAGPHRMTIPNPAADGLFLNGHRRNFVDYLRASFRHGGFPEFARRKHRPHEIDFLSEGLLEI